MSERLNGGEAKQETAEELRDSLREGIAAIISISEQLATMTDQDLGLDKPVTAEGEKSFEMTRALLRSLQVGVKGLVFRADKMDYRALLVLQRIIKQRVDWVNLPEDFSLRGGH